MAVKIVKLKPHKSVVKQRVCSECGATLEYTPNDVKSKSYSCCGSLEHDNFIKCPNCGVDLMV